MIETEPDRPIEATFSQILPEPVAAASLGQAYRGYLHSGGRSRSEGGNAPT